MQQLAAWVMSALLSLPVYKEDRETHTEKTQQYESIAQGVARASGGKPRPPREWAALVLTVGHHESGFSLRIHEGRCKPHECDGGRARGLFQMHANRYTRAAWDELVGLEKTGIQTEVAAAQLARAYWVGDSIRLSELRG